jgi:hypothetical protein
VSISHFRHLIFTRNDIVLRFRSRAFDLKKYQKCKTPNDFHVSYLILLPNRDQISEHYPCFVCGGIIYRYLVYYCMKGYALENQNVCLFVCLFDGV